MVRTPHDAIKPLTPPPPPPYKASPRRTLTFLIFAIAVTASILGSSIAWSTFESPGPLAEDKALMVHGSTLQVAHLLKQEGIIENPFLFTAITYLTGARGTLKAGEYLFTKHMSPQNVLELLQSGKIILHSLTIPEGLTTAQIVERLNQNAVLEGSVMHLPGEGTLLPQTYKFPRGETRQNLLSRMQEDRKRLVNRVWSHRALDLPIQTKEELVILASIVEKETGVADERPRVAAVMINRLRIGMRLQSDPTVIYGLIHNSEAPFNRELTKADLMTSTPYNTYLIVGLPPGPICNPGRAALEAVMNPARTKDLYFVASPSGIGHTFSTNLEEHNANVMRWRHTQRIRKSSPSIPSSSDRFSPPIELMPSLHHP